MFVTMVSFANHPVFFTLYLQSLGQPLSIKLIKHVVLLKYNIINPLVDMGLRRRYLPVFQLSIELLLSLAYDPAPKVY